MSELIHGDTLDNIDLRDYPEVIHKLAESIRAMATKLRADFTGPQARGKPWGYLFSEDGALMPLGTTDRLNAWCNNQAILNPSELGSDFQF